MEIGARFIVLPTDRLQEVLTILRQDPVLLWRVRERLAVPFQGKRVKTNELGLRNPAIAAPISSALRVVCMGESLTFGWGVNEEEAYPRVLEKILQEHAPSDRRIEVINAGQVGYSSYQGLQFFEKVIAPLAPDVVTIPFVVNDVDLFRFFRNDGRSDREVLLPNPLLMRGEAVLRHSALFRLMTRAVHKLTTNAPAVGAVRVSPSEYEENLRALVSAARKRGITIVFVKIPVNLPSTPALPDKDKDQAQKLKIAGQALYAGGDYAGAARTLEQAAVVNPYDGTIFTDLGMAYKGKKDLASARRAWARAKDCEAYRCRERGDAYNGIMDHVAQSLGVPLADIVSLFSHYATQHSERLFIDPHLDPIHPTPRGHELIARELARVVMEKHAWWLKEKTTILHTTHSEGK